MVTDSPLSVQRDYFGSRLRRRAQERHSWLCVGLDPDLRRLPRSVDRSAAGVVNFCTAIVSATVQAAVCFKINFAFFEALGPSGWEALVQVRATIPPEVPVIADAKRGDIGNTSRAYAEAILGVLDFDAVTVSPYLGHDSVSAFLEYPGKAALVLCRTSNPGALDLQELQVDGGPLYLTVARQALALPGQSEVGLVVGATSPPALRAVRSLHSDVILLVPGVGAQGGQAADAVRCGSNPAGQNALISVSREILYASTDEDFAGSARHLATNLAAETWQEPGAIRAGC